MPSYVFPKDFMWGAATAAYQIEGAAREEGRGESVWDVFSRNGGTRTGDTGDVACDHYHRFAEDIALMKELGVGHYRLSISWPRVLPEGRGRTNEKGWAFYERLVDRLLAANITPHVTLFHWDTPQALEDRYGGWMSRNIVADFADYASAAARRLGDRVRHWFTLNEVMCFTSLSYGPDMPRLAAHAPGKPATRKQVNNAMLHAMLAHGKGVQALRANSPGPCNVALVDNTSVHVPLTETPQDIEASRRCFPEDGINAQVIVPALTGRFPEAWVKRMEAAGEMPDLQPGDLETIHQQIDSVGLNVYTGGYARALPDGGIERLNPGPGYPRMDIDWLALVPESIYWITRHVVEVLGFKGDIVISENGCAAADILTPRREVLDLERIMYLRQYLRQAQRATAEGYPLKGYFQWSLMDNFEWSWGFAKRFGLYYTNYGTQERIPKASARFYAACVRENRVV